MMKQLLRSLGGFFGDETIVVVTWGIFLVMKQLLWSLGDFFGDETIAAVTWGIFW